MKSNNYWEGNGFPADQTQALVSFFIYLPIYVFISFTVKEMRKELGRRREARPVEGQKSEVGNPSPERSEPRNEPGIGRGRRQRRLHGPRARARPHLGGEDRCNLSFTNNVEAAHYFGTLFPTPPHFGARRNDSCLPKMANNVRLLTSFGAAAC